MTDTPPSDVDLHDIHTKAMDAQVGGHPGVLTSEDGSLLIKEALAAEIGFYEHVANEPSFAPLRPFLCKFYGTLKLQGKVADAAGTQLEPLEEGQGKESLVLENLAYAFHEPNILDIKLGTILYDEDATPEKKERMEKTARNTTSHETGVRLTGFQVYDNNTHKPVVVPKSYGKSIKPADLPDGIRRFFPVASSLTSATDNSPEVTSASSSSPDSGTQTSGSHLGLPANLLLPILREMKNNVKDIRNALAQVEMRMVGGSVLFIYEADWARAEEGLKRHFERMNKLAAGTEDEGEDDESSDEEDVEEGTKKHGPAYVIKLIDFAHTKITPGRGPDEGVLKGLDTVLSLLDGRIQEVEDNH